LLANSELGTRNAELRARNLTTPRPAVEARVAHESDDSRRGAGVLAPNAPNAPNERRSPKSPNAPNVANAQKFGDRSQSGARTVLRPQRVRRGRDGGGACDVPRQAVRCGRGASAVRTGARTVLRPQRVRRGRDCGDSANVRWLAARSGNSSRLATALHKGSRRAGGAARPPLKRRFCHHPPPAVARPLWRGPRRRLWL